MAYFAELNSDNIVQRVIVVADKDCGEQGFPFSESVGQQFIASLGLSGTWKQTADDFSFRKQYAGIGYYYDAESDVFITPQPYPSWALDTKHDWKPPIPMPDDNNLWIWDEATLSWILLN